RETVRSVITENLVAHSIGTTFGPPSGMAKKLEPPLRHRHEAPPSSRSRREEAHFNFRLPIFDCRFSIADFRLPNAEGPGSWPQCASATRRSLLSMNLPSVAADVRRLTNPGAFLRERIRASLPRLLRKIGLVHGPNERPKSWRCWLPM